MSVFPSRISLFSGAVALSLLASTATAGTISLTYAGPSTGNPETVRIDGAPVDYPGTGDWPKTLWAYGFNMTDGVDNFLAWCLDLGSFLSDPDVARPYTTTDSPFSSYTLDTSRVQKVFDANFKDIDVTNGDQAAGFQVALWNAVYDTDWSVHAATDSIFDASNNSHVITKANAYLEAAENYNGVQRYRMTFLESTPGTDEVKYQNLVTVSPVPLPAAGILLLAALGGLGFAGRRRKAA